MEVKRRQVARKNAKLQQKKQNCYEREEVNWLMSFLSASLIQLGQLSFFHFFTTIQCTVNN